MADKSQQRGNVVLDDTNGPPLPNSPPSNSEIEVATTETAPLDPAVYLKRLDLLNKTSNEWFGQYEKGKLTLAATGIGLGIWILKNPAFEGHILLKSLLPTLFLVSTVVVHFGAAATSKLTDLQIFALNDAFEKEDSRLSDPSKNPITNARYRAWSLVNSVMNGTSLVFFLAGASILGVFFLALIVTS